MVAPASSGVVVSYNRSEGITYLTHEMDKENKVEAATLRLKVTVGSVKRIADNQGDITQEEIALNAVYDNRAGSANAQWCKWTPFGEFKFTVSNPVALGKVLPGQFYFVDLIPTDKDSL